LHNTLHITPPFGETRKTAATRPRPFPPPPISHSFLRSCVCPLRARDLYTSSFITMIERETRTPRSRYIITIHFCRYLPITGRRGNRCEKRLLYTLSPPSAIPSHTDGTALYWCGFRFNNKKKFRIIADRMRYFCFLFFDWVFVCTFPVDFWDFSRRLNVCTSILLMSRTNYF